MSPTPQPSLDSMAPFWKDLVFKTIICPSLGREAGLAWQVSFAHRRFLGAPHLCRSCTGMMGGAWAGGQGAWTLLLAQQCRAGASLVAHWI